MALTTTSSRPSRAARIALGAAFLLLPALPCSTAAAGEALGNTRHRDGTYKFSFRYFQDWKPIPVAPDEKHVVAQYQQPGADARGVDAAAVEAYRFVTGAAAKPVTTGDAPTPPPRPRFPGEGEEPKSLRELFNERLDGLERRQYLVSKWRLLPAQGKAILSRDKVPGLMWSQELKTRGGPYLMTYAVFKKEGQDVEYGLWLRCEAKQAKKWSAGFDAIVKSFMWFDDKAEDLKGLDVLDGLPISAEKRRVIAKGLVKGWGLIVSPKKNYVILYNTMGRRNDLLGRLISERIEKIREQIYEVQFPPSAPITAVSLVRVCGNRSEYHAYGGPGGSAGYWSDGTEELVFYDASPSKQPDDDTFAVLYHEAFHQYIYYSVGEVAPHSWFNEGHGDYYAGAKYGGGKFKIGPFNWRVGTVKGAITAGPCSFEESTKDGQSVKTWDRSRNGFTPLEQLVAFTQGEYYSYPGISYAQGWSLVYFLREIVPKNPKWNAKWGKILETYFLTLKAEVNKKRPLAPKKPEPGMGDGPPGDDDDDDPPTTPPDGPAMGDPSAPPAMGDGPAAPTEPGMGDPPAEPGMDDPTPPPPDDPEDTMGIPQFTSRFLNEDDALKKALEKAFEGIDWNEFQDAWRVSIKKVSG